MVAIRGQAFDGGDRFAGYIAHRYSTSTCRFTVDVYGAGATQADATAEFGTGQRELVAQIPPRRAAAWSDRPRRFYLVDLLLVAF